MSFSENRFPPIGSSPRAGFCGTCASFLCCRSSRSSRGKRQEGCVEELNGRMIACQILITGLIARVANDSKDPLRFLSDFRDEILAVVRQVRIGGALDTDRVRRIAEQTVDELFSLMKPP